MFDQISTISLLLILIIPFAVETLADVLNVRNISIKIPDELKKFYNKTKFKKSQAYLKANTKLSILESTLSLLALIIFILLGGFNSADQYATGAAQNIIIRGLIFVGILTFLSYFLSLPFSVYSTFIIESKFGFNKTTPKTFVLDEIKSLALTIVIGIPILAAVILFFLRLGSIAWLVAWALITTVQLILMFIAPVLIMPLFNKFTPLSDGDLKDKINKFADNQNFKLEGIYTMDGSKRSTKANAYFTGFGKYKRIVLFDTLVKKHTDDELVSVLAHEIGHYKKGHIIKLLAISTIITGASLYIFSLLINNPLLFAMFQTQNPSVYASLVFFGIIFTPIFQIISAATNLLSRKFEYQADEYAVKTYRNPKAFTNALKKLSVNTLSNPTPHKLKVILDYSHPPILERIKNIERL
jgi:STE24 endopeptidase